MRDGRGAEEWYARRGRDLLPAGHPLSQVRRRRVPQGDGHPRRLVRLGMQSRRGARDAARAALAGRDVSRRLGPASRLVPLLAARGGGARGIGAPYQSVLTHGFVVDGEGRKMSKSQGQLCPAGGADPQVRRRGPAAVGGLRGLRRGHPALARDPRIASPTPTGGSATPSASSSGRWPTSIPIAIASPTTQMDEIDRWALLRLGELIARTRARLRGVPVPRGLPHHPQLLRGGSLVALSRHHQGPPLHARAR